MSKSLIITEKPSVARDITQALGGFKDKKDYFESDQYICTFAVGHILEFYSPEEIDSKYRRWRLADLPIIPEVFKVKPVAQQKKRVETIAKLLRRKDVGVVINACDAAREGELIFREIIQFAEVDLPIKRLWLQSMTKKAIRDGFASLRDGAAYDGLGAAAKCRAESDWLIGMNSTRALTVRLKSKAQRGASWSAGRVQTPTLALLVQREIEILEHIPRTYWKVKAFFRAGESIYEGMWFDKEFKRDASNRDLKEDRIFDHEFAKKIVAEIEKKPALAEETRKPKPRKAPNLFDLTALQRDANRRFGWSAARTLRAAQRCYETHKVLTYPRTSSKCLPEDYRGEVDRLLAALGENPTYGPHAKKLQTEGLKNSKQIFNDKGVSDHFAIIPTGEVKPLEGDDFKLFDLVTRQFLAAFYPPAIYEEVERITEVAGHKFKSKPSPVLTTAGWLEVFDKKPKTSGEGTFPPLVPGQKKAEGVEVLHERTEPEELETRPPARISEAGLLSLMENAGRQVEDGELASILRQSEGLGTAATRADIIENLKRKEYVDQKLRPTVKGIRLIDVLNRIGASHLTSAELTANLELHLHEIEEGKRTKQEFISEIESYIRDVVEKASGFTFEDIYPDKDKLGQCPKCQRDVFERAWFYGCTESTKRDGKKECDFLIWKDHYGRYIDRNTVRALLDKGETRELDGFINSAGQYYKAKLVLNSGSLERKPVLGSEEDSGDGFEVNEAPVSDCPVHKDGKCKVVETAVEFICTTRKQLRDEGDNSYDGVAIPRRICKRELKRPEVQDLLTKGETEFLGGFISKRGRPFKAKLVFQGSNGFQFVFPERQKKGKEKTEESEASATT